jgi:hypothetical protein
MGGASASYCVGMAFWISLWDSGILLKREGFGLRFGRVGRRWGFGWWKPNLSVF